MKEKLSGFSSLMDERLAVNFEQYLGLLLKWNRAYNLTAINDPIEIYEKHFADSATPLPFIPNKARLADIGTGAGFPGIPIKILRDDVDVTLIEATSKKVQFCEHVIRELGLKRISVVTARIEDSKTLDKVGRFDVVITRATMKLPAFAKTGSRYLKSGGRLIAMLGAEWAEELNNTLGQTKSAGLKLLNIHQYTLSISQSRRALLIFEKK